MTRINPWSRYKLYQPLYNGLLDWLDTQDSNNLYEFDPEREYGFYPDMYENESDGDEELKAEGDLPDRDNFKVGLSC